MVSPLVSVSVDFVYDGCMSDQEVYPNAPIVLVAVEVRHARCEVLNSQQRSVVSSRVGSLLPLNGEVRSSDPYQSWGEAGALGPQGTVPEAHRWASRDKRTALTFERESVTVETTDYQNYGVLRSLVELALRARDEASAPEGVDRIGLRYIDELRVPETVGVDIDWGSWVDPSLLGPVHLGEKELTTRGTQGMSVFSGEDDTALVLRYGPRDGSVFLSTSELRRPTSTPGPFFLLDMDSFWEAVPKFSRWDVETILGRIDKLHSPVRTMFEKLISDRLRNEVLRNG